MASQTSGKELPTLSGVRVKTRKRDEKQKLDIVGFRDQIIAGLLEAGDDFEAVSRFLDATGNTADYRTYGEHLFQVLFAGGLLNPGGTLIEVNLYESELTPLCTLSLRGTSASILSQLVEAVKAQRS